MTGGASLIQLLAAVKVKMHGHSLHCEYSLSKMAVNVCLMHMRSVLGMQLRAVRYIFSDLSMECNSSFTAEG
jgi:hypothetical protein